MTITSVLFPTNATHHASAVVDGWFGPERDAFGEFRWFDNEARLDVNVERAWRTVTLVGRFCEFVTLPCVVQVSTLSGEVVCDGLVRPRGSAWDRWKIRAVSRQEPGEYEVHVAATHWWVDASRRRVSLAVRGVRFS